MINMNNLDPVLTVFVAGSKVLDEERNTCRAVCNMLQNQWGTIIMKTYEDFPNVISDKGHQKEYDAFISNVADVAIFIISGEIGGYTLSELKVAYESFKAKKHPEILVCVDGKKTSFETIEKLKQEAPMNGQYYVEYNGIENLKEKIKDSLTNILISRARGTDISGIMSLFFGSSLVLGIWLVFSLLGGIGMYIYDMCMPVNDCMEIVNDNLVYDSDGRLLYHFPDKTYVYDINTKSLTTARHSKDSPSVDVSYSKVKDVTFGATASILLTRLFKVKGNPKIVIGIAVAAVGVGVGCVVEQMIFPPQYSQPIEDYLDVPANWELIAEQYPYKFF